MHRMPKKWIPAGSFLSCRLFFSGWLVSLLLWSACTLQPDMRAGEARPVIDIFEPASVNGSVGDQWKSISVDLALKRSAVAVIASRIELLDSSVNRSAGGHFYVYRATVFKTIKGRHVPPEKKCCFITGNRYWISGDARYYYLFWQPLQGKLFLKKAHPVAWQWVPLAPVQEAELKPQ